MANVTSIPLSVLRIRNWKQAPIGTLLQAYKADGGVLVGLRCERTIGDQLLPCFLVLDGEQRGQLLEEGAIRDAAVDVSSLLEIHVSKLSPQPFSFDPHANMVGIICEDGAGSGHFVVRAVSRGLERVWVRISDPIGTIFVGALPNLLVIGVTETVEKDRTN
jgi:hypothetical protein